MINMYIFVARYDNNGKNTIPVHSCHPVGSMQSPTYKFVTVTELLSGSLWLKVSHCHCFVRGLKMKLAIMPGTTDSRFLRQVSVNTRNY